MRRECACAMVAAALCASVTADRQARAGAFATSVVGYDPGSAAGSGFNDPAAALGSPERFTGEGSFPGVVSPFNPAFGTDELTQIGEGGYLVLEFDEPVTDDPAHPFGVDLIVFGNGGFIDTDFPYGVVGDPPGTFGLDEMYIEVSEEGAAFVPLGSFTEGLFPTMGYVDSGPFDGWPGSVLTDFQRTLDPALTLDDFGGLTYAGVVALYDRSGGGTPVDISASGLSLVRYVRISVSGSGTVEIDAVSRVPEPGSVVLILAGGLVAFRRARRG